MNQGDPTAPFGGGDDAIWNALVAAWATTNTHELGGEAEAAMLPYWNDSDESVDHRNVIFALNSEPCADYLKGSCGYPSSKGKPVTCFGYHDISEYRRPPVDPTSGRLLYWDLPCPSLAAEIPCPQGHNCIFSHTLDELNYHPAKFKTRMCSGRHCLGPVACCQAHGVAEVRNWAADRYSYAANSASVWKSAPGLEPVPEPPSAPSATTGRVGGSGTGTQSSSFRPKHRFCASYPDVSQCRRGSACAFAHSREEICTPLLSLDEEQHEPGSLTENFFMYSFKTLWCPIGVQHDWQTCVYAHNYQDARRKVSIGYGPRPCPYWAKKDTGAEYSARCPYGLRCPYSHGAKEQLYHPMYFRTVICRDLRAKACPRQKLCAFFHRRAERRRPPQDATNYEVSLPEDALPEGWVDEFLTPPFQEASGGGVAGASPSANEGSYEDAGQSAPAAAPAGEETTDGYWNSAYGLATPPGISNPETEDYIAALEAAQYKQIFQASLLDFYMRMSMQEQGRKGRGAAGESVPRKPSNDSDGVDETSTIDSATALDLAWLGGVPGTRGFGAASSGLGLTGASRAFGSGYPGTAGSMDVGSGGDRDSPMKLSAFGGNPLGAHLSAFQGFMAQGPVRSPRSLLGAELENLL